MNACTPHTTHPALSRLTDRSLLRTLGHIDGRWTAAPDAADFAVTDPATGALVARVASLGSGGTDAPLPPRRPPFRPGATGCHRNAPASFANGPS
jgi:aspartate-semialdehyde dehydrogenase